MVRSVVQGAMGTFIQLNVLKALLDVGTAFVDEGTYYAARQIAVAWNERLTQRFLGTWLGRKRFYLLQHFGSGVGDADQRVTSEMQEFATQFSLMLSKVLTPAFDLLWFSTQLHSILGSNGLGVLSAYNVAVWLALRAATPSHGANLTKERELESEYKFAHTRLRQQAESVAFLNGGEREALSMRAIFGRLTAHSREYIRKQAWYSAVSSLISRDKSNQYSISLPSLVLSTYLQRQSAASMAAAAGTSAYADAAIYSVVDAFTHFFDVADDVGKLMGLASRAAEMLEAADKIDADREGLGLHSSDDRSGEGAAKVAVPDGAVSFEGASIVTPAGLTLASDISFELPAHESLIVTGPNSVGKTSLFRVLAGLWPCATGAVRGGGTRGMTLVPQHCFCPKGTLRELVTYPEKRSVDVAAGAEGKGGAAAGSAEAREELDAEIGAALEVVGLRVRKHSFCGTLWTPRFHSYSPCYVTVL